MRPVDLTFCCSLLCAASAIWLPFPTAAAAAIRYHLPFTQPDDSGETYLQSQHPMMQGKKHSGDTAIPTTISPLEDTYVPGGPKASGPIVSDVLPKVKGINIFASLTRDFEGIAHRLNDSSQNVTVLAPRNSAIQALPRKPWENPEDYARFGEMRAYQGSEGEDRAKRNLRRFVEAHLLPASPWRKDEDVGTLGGGKLRWTKRGEKIYVSWLLFFGCGFGNVLDSTRGY